MEELLHALGIEDYEKLSLDERETFDNWISVLQQKGELTPPEIKAYIEKMIYEVAQKLAVEPEGTKNNIHLKARLMNYILLKAFLDGPQAAQQELKNYIERLKAQPRR